ncbi:MAG: efflux RND transporter periplasmic adaptor subunit [Nitrospirota bacterium]|nr:efflux RND transporter periplasmic adaptor subunit [Nitrospirota bacterium]MDH4361818.1 efflux RND transporter periplasmic adaptor subunit [Nitrospirota bacterium]
MKKLPHPALRYFRRGSGLLLCLLLAIIVGCDRKEAESTAMPPEVVVAEVIQQDVPMYGEWVGTTVGFVDARIRARIQGYLMSRHYTEGSVVKANDLLFKIDPRPYKAVLDQAKAELARAEAAYKKSLLDVKRNTPLAAEGAISQKELDDATQASAANRASVASARAKLENAQLNLDWTSVTSPINGIAGIATAQIGDLILENTAMTTVSQVDPIKVNFPISEREYLKFADRIEKASSQKKIHSSQKANLELVLADGSVYPHKGRAVLADRQVDVKTGTITIVSYFPNPANLLRPGLFAKVRASIETRVGALLVQQRAVQELQGTYQVAVIGDENKVAFRNVTPGPRIGSLWLIEDGLKPGEMVIVEGLLKVREGMEVTPKLIPPESSPGAESSPEQPGTS